MNFVKWINRATEMVRVDAWHTLELEARRRAAAVVEPELVAELDTLDFSSFQRELLLMLEKASDLADGHADARAFYWEFNMDNEWQSGVDICTAFDAEDPDWTNHTLGWVEGPKNPHCAQIYAINGLSNPVGEAITSLLVVRTVRSLGRALAELPSHLPVGAAFHGQSIPFLMPYDGPSTSIQPLEK